MQDQKKALEDLKKRIETSDRLTKAKRKANRKALNGKGPIIEQIKKKLASN